MSNPNEILSVGEFHRSMQRIEERFDTLDSNVGATLSLHAERIAVLESAPKVERKKKFSLAAIATTVGVIVGEATRRWFGL